MVVVRYERRIAELKKVDKAHDEVVAEVNLAGTQFSWTQELKNPSFLAEFVNIGREIDELAAKTRSFPSFDLGLNRPEMEVPLVKEVQPVRNVQMIRYTRLAKRKMAANVVCESVEGPKKRVKGKRKMSALL
ncbi:hypothetical protein RND81_09G107600 [Saponaria officinalis]|uniref:Uncharacterized protein n=1 Tax=Saponaria officinalis TaxID=3572 RepID=A0AAW1IKD8_SAPOF